MTTIKTWFVIVNPFSGNGLGKKKWPQIKLLLETYNFNFKYAFTNHANHSIEIVQDSVLQGFTNIICVGGDGTLHHIINGILTQTKVASFNINIGVIALGTGNDWIKTHNLTNDIEKAIQIIKNGNTKVQDIGKIEFLNESKNPVYFMNLAGVGFDGFVVSKVDKYKHFGAIAYLAGTLVGLFSFKHFKSKTTINSTSVETKTLMVLVGICQYSGGGMQLTKSPNPFDALLDISIAKDLTKVDIISNVINLFNGKIVDHKKVSSYKSNRVKIEIISENLPFIQADGELIGNGGIKVSILPKAFSFYA